jgi:hypothetical protein
MSATTTAICVIVMGTGGGTIRPPLPLVICASTRSLATEACAGKVAVARPQGRSAPARVRAVTPGRSGPAI